MSDARRLRDKLAKLAGEDDGRDGKRLLPPVTDGETVLAILDEVNETILPRHLVFRSADGAELGLEVANRRVLVVTDLPHDVASGTDRDRLLAPLPPDDDAALAAIADAIRDYAQRHPDLAVSAAALDRSADPGGLGRSAEALARALDIDLYDRPAQIEIPDPAQGFEAGLAHLALARASIDSGTVSPATGRDAEAVERLSSLDVDTLASGFGPDGDRAGRFVVLSGEKEALFLGQQDDTRAVAALVPADHAGAIVALWQATRDDG